ncbi:GNAT family N-acetyltransferase [Mycobacterium sp. NPDC048908]|uniref:GNAT family N-acetyltransferase n=1 Tax=Mycobacterium sp. NPDC048908 TaxID=3364292 RepID=UPI0037188B7D
MPRVCVIRCHYFRDTRVQREVAALLERGHQVHVLCLRDRSEPLHEHRGCLTITRIPLRHAMGAGTTRRLAEYAAFFLLAGLGVSALHLRRRFDLVQVNSLPDVLVFAALLPRLTGARILLDLQEPSPEFYAAKTHVGLRHPVVRLVTALEQASIRFADAAVTATEPMRQAFIARGAAPDKITVVMDGSDEEVFDPTRLPQRGRDDDKFVLVSHGTIEAQYGLDTVIEAVAQLAATIPSLELRIIGDGSQRPALQALASRLGVSDRVVFSCGFIPVDELVATLATADVGVVAMKQDRFRDLTLAGKMFDYITMGVPMVVSITRSVQETFPPGCFESFISDDPDDLARAVERLYKDPQLAMAYANRAKEAAQPYSWPVQRQHYWQVVDALLDLPATSDCGFVQPPGGNITLNGRESLAVTLTRQPGASALAMWDQLVRKVPGSDVAQLSAWADVRRVAGFEPLYVLVRRGPELVGGALVMTRKLPVVGEVGYAPYGPLISPEADRDPVIAALAAALRGLAQRKIRMLFIQPPLGGNDISRELQQEGFRPSSAGIAPVASLRLDLTRGEDELRAGLRKRLTVWTRNWPKRGVHVRRGTQDDVALLARLHAASAQYQGFEPIPHSYLANLYRRLAPDGHAELFVGEIEGRPVAARLYTSCGGVLKARLAGMGRDPAAGKLSVPAAVEWEAIRWAKANDYRWFDFGGISDTAVSILEDEQADSSMLTSAEAFKSSFGGTPFRYPTPVERISPAIRIAYDLSQRWPAGRRMVKRTANHLLRIGHGS